MKIILNGEPVLVECDTLEQLLDVLEHQEHSVVTAVNKEFVPKAERASIRLSENDLVEIIAPMAGG